MTHEDEVAKHATRVIHMRDGKIEGEMENTKFAVA